MHSISEHSDPPYIEINVYGRYSDSYWSEVGDLILRYAMAYDAFGLIEVQHGKISNGLWRLLQTGGRVSEEMLGAFKKLKRFAVVSDEPHLVTKIIAALPRFGSAEIKLFNLHELDLARAWMKL